MQHPLEPRYLNARAAWPTVELGLDEFAAHVRAAGSGAPDEPLHTDDLYLACACLRGDPAALAAFERAYADAVAASLSRFDLSSAERDDVAQTLREKFFLRRALAGYSGRGALRGWVRSAATRAALDLVAARKKRPDDDEDILAELPASGDPELDMIRLRFAEEFRRAFAETLRGLDAEDRLILAQHYIDDLGIDQLAALHGIHRATAARRVARVRELLLAGTKERLRALLSVDAETLESLMRVAASRLEVSVFRLLGV